MRRILPLLTLGLVALVLADRVAKTVATMQVSQGANPPSGELGAPRSSGPGSAAARRSAIVPNLTGSTVDRLARLATRQQLRRLEVGTYIDSLIVTTDSVLRRWPDRQNAPLRIFIREGGAVGYHPRMAAILRDALGRWEEANVGVSFTVVDDSASADISVRWIDRFAIDRAGQTDLTWDQRGFVRHGSIAIAVRTNGGFEIPDGPMLAVAVHEVGHAIGLPHSPDSNDVMFPATRTGVLSTRDRKTAQVLYHLAPGPLRDGASLTH